MVKQALFTSASISTLARKTLCWVLGLFNKPQLYAVVDPPTCTFTKQIWACKIPRCKQRLSTASEASPETNIPSSCYKQLGKLFFPPLGHTSEHGHSSHPPIVYTHTFSPASRSAHPAGFAAVPTQPRLSPHTTALFFPIHTRARRSVSAAVPPARPGWSGGRAVLPRGPVWSGRGRRGAPGRSRGARRPHVRRGGGSVRPAVPRDRLSAGSGREQRPLRHRRGSALEPPPLGAPPAGPAPPSLPRPAAPRPGARGPSEAARGSAGREGLPGSPAAGARMRNRWGARPALTAEAPPWCAEPPFFSVTGAAPPARETRTPGSKRRRSCEKRTPPGSAGVAKKTPPGGGKKNPKPNFPRRRLSLPRGARTQTHRDTPPHRPSHRPLDGAPPTSTLIGRPACSSSPSAPLSAPSRCPLGRVSGISPSISQNARQSQRSTASRRFWLGSRVTTRPPIGCICWLSPVSVAPPPPLHPSLAPAPSSSAS